MKRWIIRSFFTGVLLLCVGGWGCSHDHVVNIYYRGGNLWGITSYWGEIKLEWSDPSLLPLWEKGWSANIIPANAMIDSLNAQMISMRDYYLGFSILNGSSLKEIIIPFYFPTTISAALLWLAWRKTRPKTKGRAFPVELAKPSEKP